MRGTETLRTNNVRALWEAGNSATNCWLGIPSVVSAETMAHQGWDSATIDMQHGAIGFDTAYNMLVAISTTDMTPIVRVPSNEPGIIARVLDAGAYGVMCPTIESAADAKRFASACRYPPTGARSVGPTRASFYAGNDYVANANATIVVLAQIETAEGVANADGIARTAGIDVLFVGPSDLGLSMGRAAKPDQDDPVVMEAVDAVLSAARTAGICAGIYCASVSYALAMIRRGFDLVTVVSDEALLAAGSNIRTQFLHAQMANSERCASNPGQEGSAVADAQHR